MTVSGILAFLQYLLANPITDSAVVNLGALQMMGQTPKLYDRVIRDSVAASKRIEEGFQPFEGMHDTELKDTDILQAELPSPPRTANSLRLHSSPRDKPVQIYERNENGRVKTKFTPFIRQGGLDDEKPRVNKISFDDYYDTWKNMATSASQDNNTNTNERIFVGDQAVPKAAMRQVRRLKLSTDELKDIIQRQRMLWYGRFAFVKLDEVTVKIPDQVMRSLQPKFEVEKTIPKLDYSETIGTRDESLERASSIEPSIVSPTQTLIVNNKQEQSVNLESDSEAFKNEDLEAILMSGREINEAVRQQQLQQQLEQHRRQQELASLRESLHKVVRIKEPEGVTEGEAKPEEIKMEATQQPLLPNPIQRSSPTRQPVERRSPTPRTLKSAPQKIKKPISERVKEESIKENKQSKALQMQKLFNMDTGCNKIISIPTATLIDANILVQQNLFGGQLTPPTQEEREKLDGQLREEAKSTIVRIRSRQPSETALFHHHQQNVTNHHGEYLMSFTYSTKSITPDHQYTPERMNLESSANNKVLEKWKEVPPEVRHRQGSRSEVSDRIPVKKIDGSSLPAPKEVENEKWESEAEELLEWANALKSGLV